MENAKLTRNTISISYSLDKVAQVGYFVLSLFKDNQPVFVKDTPTVTYYRKGTADIKTWTPTLKDGFVYLNANDFSDIHKAGTYYITCILSDGDIYPSQGSAILTLEGDLPESSEVQIQPITGANGSDGASIVNIQLDKTQNHFIFTLSDGQTIETSVSMPSAVKGDKGDKGQDGLSAYQIAVKNGFKGTETEWLQSLQGPKGDSIVGPAGEKGEKGDSIVGPAGQDGSPGKDAPHVTRVAYDVNQLTFTFSDGSSLSTPFVMPTPVNGKDGKDGKDGKSAPTIESVVYDNDELTFTFSDGSKKSTSFVMPTPINGKDGINGKDAPVVTSVNYNNNELVFTFSDGTSKIAPFVMPTPVNGKDGKDGKNAPTITNVDLNDDQTQLIFAFSNGTKLQTNFKAPEAIAGPAGQNGKDAPHVTHVTYSDNQLVFTFSDGSSLSTPFIMPVPKNGIDGKNGADGKNAPTIEDVKYADNELTFTFSDGSKKSTPFVMPTPINGKDGINGKDAPTVTSITYADDQLKFMFSDGTSKSTNFKVTSSNSNVKDKINAVTNTYSSSVSHKFDTALGYYYDDENGDKQKLMPDGMNKGTAITRTSPNLIISLIKQSKDISLKQNIKDGNLKSEFSDNTLTFKPIFDELDTKANKSDLPTSETIASQIDQNLKEKLKKNIVSKITPPGFVDETGSRVQSGLSISSYNLNGDSDTMRFTPNQIVALDNDDPGYSYDIPITKISVNEQYGLVSLLLQGSLTGQSRPKKFSIGKTDISYPDPSNAEIVLSTNNRQGSAYSSNIFQIRNQSDYFSGLPVTVVNANIRDQTPEAREAFKQAFSDFNDKFYFLHIEG